MALTSQTGAPRESVCKGGMTPDSLTALVSDVAITEKKVETLSHITI